MEWLKGKVKSFSAGASAVLFEGNETANNGKAKFIPVKESIRKLVLSGRWGAEIEYQVEKIKGAYGFSDTITAVKIIKEGPKTNYSGKKGTFRSSEELTAIECINFALKEVELNRGLTSANESLTTGGVIDIASNYAKGVKKISKELKEMV